MLSTGKHTDCEYYWNEFYKNEKSLLGESTFSRFVNKQLNNKYTILDIGCGNGRDSLYFANQGHEVIGVDRSIEAIKQNNDNSKDKSNVKFLHVDLKQKDSLVHIVNELQEKTNENKKPLIVYLRFLLHSIDEETESNLLSTLAKHLKTGSYLAAEFRTIEDKERSKVYDNHYRRYISAEDLKEKVYLLGFEEDYFTKGTGLSVYKNEDPYLARIIMKKN